MVPPLHSWPWVSCPHILAAPHPHPSTGPPVLTLVPPRWEFSLRLQAGAGAPAAVYYEVERHPGERKISFYVEGLTFPDADFLGLVSLSVSLVDTKVCMALGAMIGDEGLQGPAWRL